MGGEEEGEQVVQEEQEGKGEQGGKGEHYNQLYGEQPEKT